MSRKANTRAKQGIKWTNKSVIALASDNDPVEVIEKLARAAVLAAMDAGWAGPPFSQLQLATHLGLRVEADATVRDAQTVPTADGLVIKFNPTQARERVRFSLAHECAHSLFPDCADAVRHRGGGEDSDDDWQLEMLCNIAAAEFVMPMGSVSHTAESPPLEDLLRSRRQFDVSIEAFLIRVARISREPLLMFCAAPRTRGDDVYYAVDYSVASPVWDRARVDGSIIEAASVVRECKSIGHTEHGVEDWPGIGSVHVEAVGVPAYPGDRLPRVVGLLRASGVVTKTPFEVVQGDVLNRASTPNRIVCQLVNDHARVWGGGVAGASAKKWPDAQRAYSHWIEGISKPNRLGQVHVWSDGSTTLASLVAQHGVGAGAQPGIRYAALSTCLDKVAQVADEQALPVHMPRIGTGAAGGNWEIIEELVQSQLISRGVAVTIVDPPPPRQDAIA
ncbi:MAG: hypothetical protein BroJett013_25960 [Alphaproteobacteria bacterium]|nr:MAG: hypothetical protein BroJett013_25960 [Alphaproteobacteria bacterium]